MTAPPSGPPELAELPTVAALRSLSVFSADQAGAYREHFAGPAAVLGDDVQTKLAHYVSRIGLRRARRCGLLTDNAGTGKTAVAEAYCRAVDVALQECRRAGGGRCRPARGQGLVGAA